MARTVVGLDIGTSGVRAAEFRLGRHRKPVLRKFLALPLARDAVRRGVVVDQEAVAHTLKALWAKGKFSTKAVVVGIANEGVLVRQMDLDWMPPADFRKALHYQVAEALPVPVDEANLDYHLLEELEVTDEDGTVRRVNRILLVAASRDVVDGFVTAAQGAGLRVTRADLLPFALIRAAALAGADHHQPEAIVHIGADTTSVVVHSAGRPQFVRMIPSIGSNTITKALQGRYEWSWEEAERTKIALGMHTGVPVGGEPDAQGYEHPAQEVITEEAHKLVAEIRATLEFFVSSGSDSQALSRVMLSGAGSRLTGLPALLSDQLALPLEWLSPLQAVRMPRRLAMDGDAPAHLSVSAGLCMGVGAS